MFPKNWLIVSKLLDFREKILVSFLILVVITSFAFWGKVIYFGLTDAVPEFGGEYSEGIVGQPVYINPLLSYTSDADADLVSLIYSGLFKYDDSGKIRNDLAESFEISEDKKSYTVFIRKDARWHDQDILDADDVIFTFNSIKDPAYKSPLRQNWQGVEISRIDSHTVRFDLKNPYFGFLENLTVGILPKHIWQEILPDKFFLAERNLRPIGSGPYYFSDFQKDSSGNITTYKLSAFKQYYEGSPYISKIRINFYPDEDALIGDFNKKEVSGMGNISPEKVSAMKSSKNVEIKELVIPRYFALFINQTKSLSLSFEEVRRALSKSVNRQEIIDRVLHGKGFALYSPLLPQMGGHVDFSSEYSYDTEGARKILDESGWKLDEEDGIRKKENNKLEFEIITTDWPQIAESAEILKTQWEAIGAKVSIKLLSASDFQQNYVKTREYQSMLFGQALSFSPDLYSFFHSEGKRDPGLNLSLFENKDADELLSSIRQEADENKRNESYSKLMEIFKQKNPAIFLYSQYYLYPISKSVKGVEVKNINFPSSRFSNINKWYIKTSRVLK